MSNPSNVDLYDLLGVEGTASVRDIKAAYKRQALQTHPDRASPNERDQATARFKLVAENYDFYCSSRRPSTASASSSCSSPGSYDPHTWSGSSPEGPYSFVWESSADTARRAQRSRGPWSTRVDAHDLFETMFAQELRGARGQRSPFASAHDLFANDPFFANHKAMSAMPSMFGVGLGMGPKETAFTSTRRPATPVVDEPLDNHSEFFAMETGTTSTAWGEVQSVASESTTTRIVNGARETIRRTVDAKGNETIERITDQGTTRTINGIPQTARPDLVAEL